MKKTFFFLAAFLFIAAGFALSSCGSDKNNEPQIEIDNGITGSRDIAGWAELPYLKLPQEISRIENHEKAVGRERIEVPIMNQKMHLFASGKMSVIMGVGYGIENEAGNMDPDELILFVDNAKFETLLTNLGFQKNQENDGDTLIVNYTSDKYNIVFQTNIGEENDEAVKFIKTVKGLGKTTGLYTAYFQE